MNVEISSSVLFLRFSGSNNLFWGWWFCLYKQHHVISYVISLITTGPPWSHNSSSPTKLRSAALWKCSGWVLTHEGDGQRSQSRTTRLPRLSCLVFMIGGNQNCNCSWNQPCFNLLMNSPVMKKSPSCTAFACSSFQKVYAEIFCSVVLSQRALTPLTV